jgi:hypothetical protein
MRLIDEERHRLSDVSKRRWFSSVVGGPSAAQMRRRAIFFLLRIGRGVFALEWVGRSGICLSLRLLRIRDRHRLCRLRCIDFNIEVRTIEKVIVVCIVVMVFESA